MNGVACAVHHSKQPHREAEIGLDDEIAVGRRGLGNRPHVDDRIQPAAVQPGGQFGRRHDVGELALGEVAPFVAVAEQVTHNDVRAARLVERGHDIRSDKTGPTGHQQHAAPYPVRGLSFAPVRPAGNFRYPTW